MQRDVCGRHGGQRLQLQVAVAEGTCDAVLENQHEQINSNADASTKKQGIGQQRFDSSVVLGSDAVRHQGVHGLRQPENRHVDDEVEVAHDGEGRHALGANLTHQYEVEDIGGDRRRNRSQHLRRAVEKHLLDFLASPHHLAEADKAKQHQSRRGVGDAGGYRGSGHAPAETQHEEIVQDDVHHAADDTADKHPVGLPVEAREGLREVGDAVEDEAATDDAKVLSDKRIHLIITAKEITQGPEEKTDQHGQRRNGDQQGDKSKRSVSFCPCFVALPFGDARDDDAA